MCSDIRQLDHASAVPTDETHGSGSVQSTAMVATGASTATARATQARTHGSAVAKCDPHSTTGKAIRRAAQSKIGGDARLVRISAVVDKNNYVHMPGC
jgi:hypothetical protein